MANFKKTAFTGRLLLCALLLYAANNASGQTEGEYIKSLNSLVPGTPEASGIMKAIDFPVTLFSGQPNISIPLCSVNGKSLSVPVSISYTATNGIRINEMAGKCGLGWLLSGGGEITREVRSSPDEFGQGLVNLQHFTTLKANIINDEYGDNAKFAARGTYDLEPDMFYFTIPGGSGKFMYDMTIEAYVCTQLEPYIITYNKPANTFTMTGPEGNTYLFDKDVKTTTTSKCNFNTNINTGNQITTSWKLSKIMNADKTDSITIAYDNNSYTYITDGSSTKYLQAPGDYTTLRPNLNCFTSDYISGWEKTLKICSVKDTITFNYSNTNREDYVSNMYQKAIETIVYSNGEPAAKTIFKFDYDYYIREYYVGIDPIQTADATNKKSLRLKQITNFGNAVTNPDPLKWIFTYNPLPLPARLSYCQDFWGYYNQNDVSNTLVPQEVLTAYNGNLAFVDGADRYTDTTRIKAGILEKIQFPTGGTTTFEYEPNTTAVPTPMARPVAMLPISNVITEGSSHPYHDSTLTFIVNVPNNTEINLIGGVLADVSIQPITPVSQQNPAPDREWGYPYFSLSKVEELDGNPAGTGGAPTFARLFWRNPTERVHLPNGKYEMTVYSYGFTGNPGSQPYDPNEGPMETLGITYTVNYYIPDTARFTNYQLGGLRIKSITSQDQYSNIVNTKEYKYHNPVSDSSYGMFIGSTMHDNNDYLVQHHVTPLPQAHECRKFYYTVRHGNCIMPGINLGAPVVYPKVTEYTIDGNNRYKTEHNFSYNKPIYNGEFPYAPPAWKEWKHGKALSSTAFKTVDNGSVTDYQNAKTTMSQYDFDPQYQFDGQPHPMERAIEGLKTSFWGYTDNVQYCGEYDYVKNKPYSTFIGRADLTSDTVVTYDLNNQYNGVKEWHDYAYGDYTQQPIVVRTGNSDGSVNIQKNYFAKDHPEHNPDIYTNPSLPGDMVLKNRVSMPLATKQFKDNQLLSRQVTNAHFDANGNKFLIDNMQQALFSDPLETEISVLEYDDAANPLSIKMKGDKYRKYIWNMAKSMPLATCVMANNDRFAFTSFEYPNEYSWNENSRVLTNPFSGKYAYNLGGGDIEFPPFSNITHGSTEVDAYVWATAATFSINGSTPESTGKTKGSYTLYHKRLVTANSFRLSSGGVPLLLDQVVIIPVGSQFQGNVYDAGNRVTAIVNDQIMTSFFEYDNFGRLSSVKDEQGNIIKSSSYQYQGPQ